MLTSRQRAYLRGISNGIPAIFQVGKGGVNENQAKQISEALEARELIKVSVLKNADADAREISSELAEMIDADVVQVIGNKFILYKESRENKSIVLP